MRDAVAAATGATQLSWLWVGTLGTMLAANAVFSAAVVRVRPRRIVPYAYHAIAASLIVFYFAFRSFGAVEGSRADVWMGRAFYIWTSVFNLFVASLFWSYMADAFRSEQAKRLFGFIGVGGTLGSITGSATTAELAERLGSANLLLVSAMLLEVAVLVVMRFPHAALEGATAGADVAGAPADPVRGTRLGGSAWAGFTHTIKSPYLLGAALFIALFTFGSSFLYFEQSAIVGAAFPDRTSRTVVLARIEVMVQVLTVLVQVFLTGRLIRWFGLAAALAFLPALSMAGFSALGFTSGFTAVAAFVVLRRAGNFALTNPAMEVLFTVVPREDKYKSKSFIETFVYRFGDQLGAWTFAGLAAAGLSLTSISWTAVPISAVWFVLAVWLARRQGVLARAAGG
jgi:AAA family ATP:ADP antiporter